MTSPRRRAPARPAAGAGASPALVRPPQRLSGPTRFETATAAATRWPHGAPAALVATGTQFADALAATPVAARADAPVLLTAGRFLPARRVHPGPHGAPHRLPAPSAPAGPGQRGHRTVDIRGARTGDRVLLTDAAGFTIGSLAVSANNGATEFTLTSTPDPGAGGVRRRYALTAATGTISGDLSLHYRNGIESVSGAPQANWYATNEPGGAQPTLAMIVAGQRLPSRVNPFSNKVTAPVTLGAGRTEVQLLQP